MGLQRKTQKDLSRILRTESAIKEIERKANSKKYNNLWPKAVLEALDEAIRENRYESALKVCERFVLCFFFLSAFCLYRLRVNSFHCLVMC